MYRVVGIALALMPVASEAAPVYLTCQLPYGSGKSEMHEMDITLNEDAGTVTFILPKFNLSYTVPGVFTADKVTFHDNKELGATTDYTIDRTNLALRESILPESAMPAIMAQNPTSADAILKEMDRARLVNNGKCALTHVKRAF